MPKKRIIYSLKLMNRLVERGFCPVQTMPNPRIPAFQCWIFDVTDDFQKTMDELLGGESVG